MSTSIPMHARGYYKKGDKGPVIEQIQHALDKAGFWTFGRITNYYGDVTKAAIVKFQKSKGLKADGLAGKDTIGALNKSASSSTNTPLPTSPSSSSSGAGGVITHSYTGTEKQNIDIIIAEAKSNGITNPKSIIGLLSVIGKESHFIPQSEKMHYSKGRLAEVWSVFSKTGKAVPKGQGINNYNAKAVEYAGDDQKLANFVYGGKYGNGPESSGDGYKYRGRGFNQITFKGTYEKYAKLTGKDLVNNPDLLNDPKVAAEAAIKFLLNRFKTKSIDPNSFTTVQAALEKFAGANAGWGKSPASAIANAERIKPKFSIA